MAFQLLLLEDDKELGALILQELERESYKVYWAQSLAEALAFQGQHSVDLAIVDLFLPDGQGFEYLKTQKEPVIMMSAMNNPTNRLQGIELGAVEFIPKPFLMKELLLKIHRQLDSQPREVFNLGEVVLDMAKRQVVGDKGSLFLNRRDYKILEILIKEAPKVLTRDDIIDHVYGVDQNPSHRTIDNTIVGLRNLLHDHNKEIIRSVRGEGYQWGLERTEK